MELKTETSRESFFATAMAFSAVSLSVALTISKGGLSGNWRDPVSLALLTLALLACFAAMLFPNARVPAFPEVPLLRIVARSPVFSILVAGCSFQLFVLIVVYEALAPLLLLGAATAAACFFLQKNPRRWTLTSAVASLLLLAICVMCAVAVLRFVKSEVSDVIVVQSDSIQALLHGRNPYTLTFSNIYNAAESRRFYGAGTVVDGRVKYGFPYPPLSLFWVLPAQFLLGDFRYGHLAALALSAIFIAALRPSRVTLAAAMLLVFSAPAFLVLQVGWTEPVGIMMLCAAVWLAARESRGVGIAVGLLAISKQYFALMFPLMFFLPLPRGANTRNARWKTLAVAIATALLVVLPFVLWNARAFWDGLVTLQLHQPFRIDALNYAAFIKLKGGPQLPNFVGFGAAALSLIFCIRRAPRTVAGFAISTACVYLSFFAFGKQASANYYFFVLAALCCATAAAQCESDATPEKPAV